MTTVASVSDYLAGIDVWEVLGWVGQGFFFSRFLVQWMASERAKRIVVPIVFWWMSLAGAVCTASFALSQSNLVFLAAPTINLFVYGRNLWLLRSGRALGQRLLWPFACGLATLCAVALWTKVPAEQSLAWLVVGIAGAALWVSRFPLQWWLSERQGRSTLPRPFFWVSFAGSVLLLAYAIHTGRAVWIAGYVLGPFLYGRSLMLAYREKAAVPAT